MNIEINTENKVIKNKREDYFTVHNKIRTAISKGLLKIQPCEVCGDEWSVAHHEDYTKTYEVRWLCRKHHMARHKELNNNKIYHKRKLNETGN